MTETTEQVLSGFVRIGGFDGHPDPKSLIGTYGQLKHGNVLTRDSSLQHKNVDFELGSVGSLKDGTYYANKRTRPFRLDGTLSSFLFGGEQGETLTTKPENAILEFKLTDIHYCQMKNVKENLLGKLSEVKILGRTLPDFFLDYDIHLVTGVIWGNGTWEIVNQDPKDGGCWTQADHIVLGVSLMRFDSQLFYGVKPIFHPQELS